MRAAPLQAPFSAAPGAPWPSCERRVDGLFVALTAAAKWQQLSFAATAQGPGRPGLGGRSAHCQAWWVMGPSKFSLPPGQGIKGVSAPFSAPLTGSMLLRCTSMWQRTTPAPPRTGGLSPSSFYCHALHGRPLLPPVHGEKSPPGEQAPYPALLRARGDLVLPAAASPAPAPPRRPWLQVCRERGA